MFKKRVIYSIVSLLLLCLILSGCGNSDASGSGDGKKIVLTYWDASWNKDKIGPKVIKEFEKENPNIKVNVQYFPVDGMEDKFLLALKNKSGPDLVDIACDWTTPLAAVGGLLPLDDYIDKDKVDMNDFWKGALQTIHVNGKVYALPYRSETHGIFYNKDIFKQSGLDPSKAPQTWEEVLADAKTITQKGGVGFGLVGKNTGDLSYQVINFIRSFGGDVLSTDNKKSLLDQPEAIAAVKYYVSLYKDKLSPSSTMSNTNTEARNLFSSGKVGMYLSGVYDVDPIKSDNPNTNFGVGMYPDTPGKDRKLTLGGWNIAATSFTKHPEAAWKFVKFISSPKISVQYSNTFSSRKSEADNPKYKDPQVKPFAQMLQYGVPLPAIPQITQIRQIINDQVQKAMLGKASVESAMKDASKQVNELLNQ
ncbi:sugar ABC transporter substrate-binding protein [Pullulanibacillus camelliae]|uniref:Sugar ABC transporter substrate-binding protein n=1 Tax=Pullulanibacillus camelliae TaxID=1707096 RepID=A0A8J2VLA8_9BACL|nr:sugar ABC transporter substrate-binding protein [Pullulanibacillus camelliae]GGE31394.1 sugar ABC transporter substrate-binding protein [Pullulanibacillus camelliae]